MKELFHQLSVLVGFVEERNTEEKLNALIHEHKHRSRMDDILRIRRSGDYIPDYNRPRLYTDYQLIRIDDSTEVVVSMNTITSCARPVDFGSDLEKWIVSIRKEHTNMVEMKRIKKLQDIQRKEVIDNQFSPYVMRQMMEVN